MLSSLSFLSIVVIVIVTVFIGWSSIVIFSEGQTEIPSIRITSPTNGQNISTGSTLTISGSATGTNTTSPSTGNNKDDNRCYVSVIVNNIKPYQNAVATGHGGKNDYSTWKYTITSKYAALKQGQNKITSKISCIATPTNLTKFNSVNVTGTGR